VIDAMWASPCVQLEASIPLRIALLKDEYVHFLDAPERLNAQLDRLVALHGHDTVGRWKSAALAGQFDTLVSELLVNHYDPAYTRSTLKHYPQLADAPRLALAGTDDAAFARLAENCRKAVMT